MKKLFISANYLVAHDDSDNLIGEFSTGTTIYKETETAFLLKESVKRGELTILKSEVDAGDWLDAESAGSAYTQETLRTVLRENTGFKTASGGSGVNMKYAERTITAAELISQALTGEKLIIVPAQSGKYYNAYFAVFEYKFGTIEINVGTAYFLENCGIDVDIPDEILSDDASKVTVVHGNSTNSASHIIVKSIPQLVNKPIQLAIEEVGGFPNQGDGELIVKVYYEEITLS